jgi:hypothetical protein
VRCSRQHACAGCGAARAWLRARTLPQNGLVRSGAQAGACRCACMAQRMLAVGRPAAKNRQREAAAFRRTRALCRHAWQRGQGAEERRWHVRSRAFIRPVHYSHVTLAPAIAAMSGKAKPRGGGGDDEAVRMPLQAVVLADSFTQALCAAARSRRVFAH